MDNLDFNFFSVSRSLVFFTVIAIFIGIEYFFSLHQLGKAGFRKRRVLNWYLGIINMLIVFPISTLGTAYYCEYYKIGLFYYFHLPWWLLFLIWFLIYDAYTFFFHRMMHTGFFWNVHKVHHTESSLNITTSYRLHPIESVWFITLKVGLILIFGPYFFILLMSDLIQTTIIFFAHSNIKLNTAFERFLSRIIATPRYHLMHHVEQCNQNYAGSLTLWDRLAGTFTKPIWTDSELNQLKLGLPELGKCDNLRDLLLISQFISCIKNRRVWRLKNSFFVIVAVIIVC
jgi:sterol desaturase/sphingolipid hydroxylase (fatty acid hydroxylase superfamily)